MKKLSVGDIGVLQNLIERPRRNGLLVEVIAPLGTYTYIHHGVAKCGNGYWVLHLYKVDNIKPCNGADKPHPDAWFVEPHKIRPLSDPDQQPTEQQEEEMV